MLLNGPDCMTGTRRPADSIIVSDRTATGIRDDFKVGRGPGPVP